MRELERLGLFQHVTCNDEALHFRCAFADSAEFRVAEIALGRQCEFFAPV